MRIECEERLVSESNQGLQYEMEIQGYYRGLGGIFAWATEPLGASLIVAQGALGLGLGWVY